MQGARAALWIALALSFGGCLGRPINGSCAWPHEPAAPLDLRTRSDQRHLNADARFAEELAIRYADLTSGKRSGHFTGFDDYRRTRERCLAGLSDEVARGHGVSPAEVVSAVGRRDDRLDALVLLVFAAVYALAVNGFVRQLFIRIPPDERWPALAGAAAGALIVSTAGVVLGGLGATVVEMIQIGDTHMSYRAERLPWSRHWPALLVGGVIVFALIAAIRWKRAVTFSRQTATSKPTAP